MINSINVQCFGFEYRSLKDTRARIIMSFASGRFNYTKLLLRVPRFHGGLIDSWMANRHEHYQSNSRLITHDARISSLPTNHLMKFHRQKYHRPYVRPVAGKLFPKKEFPEFHPNSARPLCPRIFTWPSVIATWKTGPIGRGKKRRTDGRNRRLIVGDRRVGDVAIEKKEFKKREE